MRARPQNEHTGQLHHRVQRAEGEVCTPAYRDGLVLRCTRRGAGRRAVNLRASVATSAGRVGLLHLGPASTLRVQLVPGRGPVMIVRNRVLASLSPSSFRQIASSGRPSPHRGPMASCSSGRYLLASSMRRCKSSTDSTSGTRVEIRPSTATVPLGTKRNGSKPPDCSVSYSSNNR